MNKPFIVPKEFVVNSIEVLAMDSPANIGKSLMQHLAQRVGHKDLADIDLLDFGCGSRFTDSIINCHVPVKKYVGVDANRRMIAFLTENVDDPALSYHHFNSFNHFYNQKGIPLTEDSLLPFEGQNPKFDLITMYSVITHQLPEDAFFIFKMLRRYVRQDGHMFFTATIDWDLDAYRENDPNMPTAYSCYALEFLSMLVRLGGWKIISMLPRDVDGLPMMESFVCSPI